MIKKIGILTSGGDAPGMNSALIGAIRSGINANKEMYVIYDGYKGLIEGKIQKVNKDTFKDIFDKYLNYYEMKNVKTTNMGSMFELQYLVTAKKDMDEKAFIDEIRCRNGNLNISLGMMPDKHDTML